MQTGQRTFLGPRKSIHPDKAALFNLFSNASLSWDEFSSSVNFIHKDRQGSPYPRNERYSVFRYPAPDCMCSESYVQFAANEVEEAQTRSTNASSSEIL